MKIKYPPFWDAVELSNENTVSFSSPDKNVGVIIQKSPIFRLTPDEELTKRVDTIKRILSNATFVDARILQDRINSTAWILLYQFNSDNKNSTAMEIINFRDHNEYIFSYYAHEPLFERFLPLAQSMYASFQIPFFGSPVFSEDIFQLNVGSKSNSGLNGISSELETVSPGTINYSRYNNESLGLSIVYPDYMTRIEDNQGVLFSDDDNNLGIIFSKVFLNNMSLTNFMNNYLNHLNNTLIDFKIINHSISNSLGYPTELILFTYENQTLPYTGLQFWKSSGNLLYLLTYYAQGSNNFENNIDVLTRMIESVKLSEEVS